MTFDDQIRNALDRAMADVRPPLEHVLRTLAQDVAVEAADARARVARAEIDEARRAAALSVAELRGSTTRLVDAIRALDAARSLGEVLNVLAEHAGHAVDRVALLVVRRGRLRGCRSSGFSANAVPVSFDLSLEQAGLAGAVVQTGTMMLRPATGAASSPPGLPALPPFAQDAGARDAAALPIVLGGTVAAVLYADAAPADDVLNRWPAALDLLVRHASRVLEAMTIGHITGLSGASAGPTGRVDRSASPRSMP